jgi:hypothetical protein
MGYVNLVDKIPKDLADKIAESQDANRRLFRLARTARKRKLTLQERREAQELVAFCERVHQELYERMGLWYCQRLRRLIGGSPFYPSEIRVPRVVK